jgi:hypothetical protein
MENQTRFDLNAAIENWRQELAAQSNLTMEVRRELETHLRDTVAELRQRGLNDEESFWLARRRVGQPKQLGEEFVKADPAKIWRERVFWMAVGLLAIQMWTGLSAYLLAALRSISAYVVSRHLFLPDWVLFYLPIPSGSAVNSAFQNLYFVIAFNSLPIIWLAVLLARGRMNRVLSALQFLFKSRRRFLFVAGASLAIYCSWMLLVIMRYAEQGSPVEGNPSVDFVVKVTLLRSTLTAAHVVLIAWLMPPQNRKALKRA